MERKIVFAEGEFYHIYNRGVDKRKIYLSVSDYKRFLALLYITNDTTPVNLGNFLKGNSLENINRLDRERPLVAIGAYCLMPNHFHILLTPLVDQGVSKFMLKLQTAYSMYFNKKYERSGALFQGKFKAEHADSDNYLKYLYAYIHLNPAKLKDKEWKEGTTKDFVPMQKIIQTYPYSSCAAYVQRDHTITNPKLFPEYFDTAEDFKNLLKFWIAFQADQAGIIKGGP